LARFQGKIMGFWSTAGNVANGVVGELAKRGEELRKVREEYESKSDDELLKITKDDGFFGSSSTQKAVARQILKSRGY
jgi:hypothetical protein